MQQPWLSILVPVFNVAPYLEACLKSITQDYMQGVEIIAVDDASTDNSLTILQDFASTTTYPFKVLKHATHLSVSASRNTLLNHASGNYIWFVDSDDALTANAVQRARAIVDQHAPDLILCDFFVWRETTTFKHKLRGELHKRTFNGEPYRLSTDADTLFKGAFTQGQFHLWSKIAKRRLWGDDLRFPVGRLMEDLAISPLLLLRAVNYIYVPEVWVAYRQRPGSILATPNPKRLQDSISALEGILEPWLEKHPNLSASARFAFTYFCAKIFVSVARRLAKVRTHENTIQNHYKQDFLRITQSSYWFTCCEYLKRGWLLRALRFITHIK